METENPYHVPDQQDWQDPEMAFSVDAEVDNALREVRTFLKERIRSWIREDEYEPVS